MSINSQSVYLDSLQKISESKEAWACRIRISRLMNCFLQYYQGSKRNESCGICYKSFHGCINDDRTKLELFVHTK